MMYASKNANPGLTSRRRWLAAAGTLTAVLTVLLVVIAVQVARSDQPAIPTLGAASPSPSVEPTPTGQPNRATGSAEDPGGDTATVGGGAGGSGSGGGPAGSGPSGSGSGGGGDQSGGNGGEQPEEPEEPAGPRSVEAKITSITPNGHCSASGTITVQGGQYPVTVKYQWRALAFGEGWDGVAVTPVLSHTFHEPGGISIQTNQLPEDGTNVFLTVTEPVSAGSGLATYNGCSGNPGGGVVIGG
ncbi:MAG TPA: hypothetical protein VIL37_09650 [Natronosporangium sp.]